MKGIKVLVLFAAALAGVAHAQAPASGGNMPRVGIYLSSPLSDLDRNYVAPFIAAMRELNWVEGRNVVYDREYPKSSLRWNDDKGAAEMVKSARALISRKPSVIWLGSSESALAVLSVERQVPVVGAAVSEVVARGFAVSVSRTETNFTGISNIDIPSQLGGKRLELLKEAVPKVRHVAVLLNPASKNNQDELELIRKVGESMGVRVTEVHMTRATGSPDDRDPPPELLRAFAEMTGKGAEAVLIAHLPMFQRYSRHIGALALKNRIPAVGHRGYFSDDGALLSYGTDLPEQIRESARMVDRILKGTKPNEMPVVYAKGFEFVINTDTARALGVTFPISTLVRKPRKVPDDSR